MKPLRKLIREHLLREYLTNDGVYLRQYFNMTEEQKKAWLPYEYPYFFKDFLIEKDVEFEWPKAMVASMYVDEPDDEVEAFDGQDSHEFIEWLSKNNKEMFDKYADHLYERISDHTLPIPEAELPTWSYFDDTAKLVKNQWLIHFTDDADGIARDGFKYGVSDMTKLGLTTSLGEFEKKYGGYNFAYKLSDFRRYGGHSDSRFKYGKEAVIFRASGLQLWHHGDQEPQVIFYGNTAQNIIPITSGENSSWALRSNLTSRILFEDDALETVVNWLVKNYPQYRRHLQ